jgi:hypothetical protein
LGFEETHIAPDLDFAVFRRGGAVIQFLKSDDEGALAATANNVAVYLWVTDLLDLYDSLAPRLEALPEGRLRKPFVQDYGMREFHVKDPDECLLFFAEDVDPAKSILTFD